MDQKERTKPLGPQRQVALSLPLTRHDLATILLPDWRDVNPMTRPKQPSTKRIRQTTKELRRKIDRMDFVASGTLHSRTKVCGRSNCKCATDPEARHGPYHEWSRRSEGKLRHSVVSPGQAELLRRAIANYREILALLGLWEEETAAEILSPENAPERKS